MAGESRNPRPIGALLMTREDNIACLQRCYQEMASTTDPNEMLVLREMHYLFSIVEAVLTGNIDSLPTAED